MALPAQTLDDTEPHNLIALSSHRHDKDQEKTLPLPTWLVKVYFIFPVVLYVPDAIFNYYVYSDGGTVHNPNPVVAVLQVCLWGFLAIGVVGMAYLLSVLAPWHWGQGHVIKAFFCGVGVLVATAITAWCSIAFRSTGFVKFPTDEWVFSIWPQLRASGFSLTMLLVALAPPFWGLFWAIVQPTATGRSLRQLQESHAERLLRTQQEAELKALKAETSAKVREAQLKSMASTAAAARKQATQFIGQRSEHGNSEVTITPSTHREDNTVDALPTPAVPVATVTTIASEATSHEAAAPALPEFMTPRPRRPRNLQRGLPEHVEAPRVRRIADSQETDDNTSK